MSGRGPTSIEAPSGSMETRSSPTTPTRKTSKPFVPSQAEYTTDQLQQMPQEFRIDILEKVKRGDLSVDDAMDQLRASLEREKAPWKNDFRTSPKKENGAPDSIGRNEMWELEKLGDWAEDAFEWDATDVNLTTNEGLTWLQELGVVSKRYQLQDLDDTQKSAVQELITKMESDKSQTPLHAMEEVEKVIRLLPDPDATSRTQASTFQTSTHSLSFQRNTQSQKSSSADIYAQPNKPSRTPSATHVGQSVINEVTRRLAQAWAFGVEAMKANRLLELEMSKMLLLSRSRLQAEIISLRRENEALRQGSVTNEQVVSALTAEKRLTAALQRALDERDERLMLLMQEMKSKNDELAVLRATRDSSGWRQYAQRKPSSSSIDPPFEPSLSSASLSGLRRQPSQLSSLDEVEANSRQRRATLEAIMNGTKSSHTLRTTSTSVAEEPERAEADATVANASTATVSATRTEDSFFI